MDLARSLTDGARCHVGVPAWPRKKLGLYAPAGGRTRAGRLQDKGWNQCAAVKVLYTYKVQIR
jgi:hypothetical protein